MADVREREKIAREIEKTSKSIRKKHCAPKTGRIEEDMPLDRHFKPYQTASAFKRERKEEEEEKEEEEREKESETFERSAIPHKSDDRSHDRVQPIISTPRTMIVPTIESLDNVFETTDDSLATKVQNQLQTSRGVASRLGSAGSKIRQGCPERSVR
ncbi:hypothetical protein G5I_05055 [Acromyrmex echinatior]|uniref:Uncharacterized protein n=1 Tax=Acromyrmex echinatior TaxID=103372 RepID=F4WH95_ACREC|nr:hypothetical protein G5I_05055 [Acromyrmex echinatior]